MSSVVRVRFRDPGSHDAGPTPTHGTRVFAVEEGQHVEIKVTNLVLMAKPNGYWQAVITLPVEAEGEVTANVIQTLKEDGSNG